MAEEAFRLIGVEYPHISRSLIARIQQRIVEITGQVMAGLPKTFDEYQYRVGQVDGLKEALIIFDDEKKKQEN